MEERGVSATAVATAPEAVPRTRVVRTDQRTRDLVNQAVASIPALGLQRAAEFLASVDVPAEVAVRTLTYPERRRRV